MNMVESFTCPVPLRHYPQIVLGHGSGGRMMAELIEHLFVPLFANPTLARLGDSAVLPLDGLGLGTENAGLAFTTDAFVVQPLFFPGGDIGELAVNGTINDLAMVGARPLALSAAFILEEGLALDDLGRIATSMARAAQTAGVPLITGDTKVVNKGHGDGAFITTSGLGLVPAGVQIGPDRARPGDVVLVSGTLGDHGMAVMSMREGLEFETAIESDTAPLHTLVAELLAAVPDVRCLRDPTRGGLAATLNEFARASQVGILFDERVVPVRPAVRSACEMLGLDPFYVANEGKLVAVVPPEKAEVALMTMRRHPLGHDAALIGQVVADHPGVVAARTLIGSTRVVDLPAGELLPRIC